MRLVSTRRNILFPLVYLPISTTTVEKVFSVMKIVNTRLQNRIGYQFLVDYFITYIEKDIFNSVDNEIIIYCNQIYENLQGSIMNLFLLLFLNYKLFASTLFM